jgi:hypothetical protein
MRLIGLIVIIWPTFAWGYTSPGLFDTAPSADSTGGSGGIYYTGSPRFQGQDCSGCHQGGEGELAVRFNSLPAGLFDGDYRPGQVYHLEIDLLEDRVGSDDCADEHPGEPCNLNLFAMEVIDGDGLPAGRLCPVQPQDGLCPSPLGAPTVLSVDGTTIFASGLAFDEQGNPRFRDGETAYALYWQAPSTDVGEVAFWVSAVDGDGARTRADLPSDVANDPTGVFRLSACGPSGCAGTTDEDSGGCAAAPFQTSQMWLLIVLLPALLRRLRHG